MVPFFERPMGFDDGVAKARQRFFIVSGASLVKNHAGGHRLHSWASRKALPGCCCVRRCPLRGRVEWMTSWIGKSLCKSIRARVLIS